MTALTADRALDADRPPLIVGIGGTTRPGSSTELAVAGALAAARAQGADTLLLGAAELDLPLYAPHVPERTQRARALVDAVRRADGLVLGSPGYHGGISGLVKNALDYVEDLRDDARPYLDGRAVGCVVCAFGWQATATTLVGLRSIVHALRGWPTPLGVCLNSRELAFADDALPTGRGERAQLRLLGEQVTSFAFAHHQAAGTAPAPLTQGQP